MKKILLMLIPLLAFSAGMSAQTVEMVQEYTQFHDIEVSKYFEVELVYSETYSTKVVCDQVIKDNVQVFVKGSTLYLTVDEKGYSAELKKSMKGKNGFVPVLKAKVFLPKFSGLTVKDKAVVYADENIKSDVMKIDLSGDAVVKNLTLDTQDIKVTMIGKSQARFDIYSNSVQVETSNNANVTFALNCQNLILGAQNNANVTAHGEFKTIAVKAQNSAVVNLSGNASGKLTVDGKNSADVNANSLVLDDAELRLDKGQCEVNAKKHLTLDLQGGATVEFSNTPVVNITRIISSTVVRSGDNKKKK
ncbi:MAG: DUF2807 domain-containing protein [Bacteroidales bacterium]|nr:DUF2807 domain-containing protein [Bacteroidales bacterium]